MPDSEPPKVEDSPRRRAEDYAEIKAHWEARVYALIHGDGTRRRHTQDSPIYPEVWEKYFRRYEEGSRAVDLLLNPHRESSPRELWLALQECEARARKEKWVRPALTGVFPVHRAGKRSMVFHESHAVARLWLDELIWIGLPLTKWWWEYVWTPATRMRLEKHFGLVRIGPDERLVGALAREIAKPDPTGFPEDLLWLVQLLGWYCWLHGPQREQEVLLGPSRKKPAQKPSRFDLAGDESAGIGPDAAELARLALQFLAGMPLDPWAYAPAAKRSPRFLWAVTLNRTVTASIWESVPAVKADAVQRLFQTDCSKLAWAIIDNGIDASHPALQDRDQPELGPQATLKQILQRSRVAATYDFTRLRTMLDDETSVDASADADDWPREARLRLQDKKQKANDLKEALKNGRSLNWVELEPLLRVEHEEEYAVGGEHGTHVAGILAADHRASDRTIADEEDHDLQGMCPNIRLYDLRVLDKSGNGSEYAVMAAMQFVRYLNSNKDRPAIHGVNLSLSIPHRVDSFACGRTPVCDECERLVGSGVVVVAAAGNRGYTGKLAQVYGLADYQAISITDPGNAESVITVGATHRSRPHTYGVSYFSSRGPTGDGRSKPDLLAPGEKIKSIVPNKLSKTMDGTSMAAPHVSGAAALLMARHAELAGQPAKIKQILCRTATDLGRERYFQGAGMVDILRAMQSV